MKLDETCAYSYCISHSSMKYTYLAVVLNNLLIIMLLNCCSDTHIFKRLKEAERENNKAKKRLQAKSKFLRLNPKKMAKSATLSGNATRCLLLLAARSFRNAVQSTFPICSTVPIPTPLQSMMNMQSLKVCNPFAFAPFGNLSLLRFVSAGCIFITCRRSY